MSWVYKSDSGRYLHSWRIDYHNTIQDMVWSEHQHDAFRFDDRNQASSVAFRCGESGTLKRLVPRLANASPKEEG